MIDGDIGTKWYSANGSSSSDMSKCWLQVDFAEAQEVTAYDWATGGDSAYSGTPQNCRDPRKFRLLGSNDGVAWAALDNRDIGMKNMTRSRWTGPYALVETLGATTVSGGCGVSRAMRRNGAYCRRVRDDVGERRYMVGP